MPCYSEKFLKTQFGRSIAVHYDPPHGVRRKGTVTHGFFAGVEDRMMVVRVHGEEYPTRVEQDADQPAFATHDRHGGSSVWWEWTSPQFPIPAGFEDE